MAPKALDSEIDRLYQLPLDEFTPARNAIAKGAGAEAARIRGLAKPPIAAWAVNQLYWRKPDIWKALLAAAENAQRVQRSVLAGRAGDVRAASKVHDDAVEQALRATLALLAEAGQPATDATKHAIGTTLRALPGDESAGRLTRTLQPAGFGILTGLSVAKKPPPSTRESAVPRGSQPKVDVKALMRARQAAASAARALRDAENTARREEFERVRTEREEQRAEAAVEKARDAAKRAAAALEEAEEAASDATRLRKAAAERAAEASKALSRAHKEAESSAAELASMEN